MSGAHSRLVELGQHNFLSAELDGRRDRDRTERTHDPE